MHHVCPAVWGGGENVSECQPAISDTQSAPQEAHQLRHGVRLLVEKERLHFYVMSRSSFVQIIAQECRRLSSDNV